MRTGLVFACIAVSAEELGFELPALKLILESTKSTKIKTRLKPSEVGVPTQGLGAEQTHNYNITDIRGQQSAISKHSCFLLVKELLEENSFGQALLFGSLWR